MWHSKPGIIYNNIKFCLRFKFSVLTENKNYQLTLTCGTYCW